MMKSFTEILTDLPEISHLDAIELYRESELLDTIPNLAGKSGSLRVYHALYLGFGQLDAEAARAALELFAEHVADARANPGKHPNIDRLFAVIAQDDCLQLRPLPKTGESA